jgi:hypothetical protein
MPDATLKLFHAPYPDRTPLFLEIDNRVGWYGGASWSIAGIGKLVLYRYDNDADPAKHQHDYLSWRTRFWNLGWESHIGSIALLAQGVTGDTAIEPSPGFVDTTQFKSAYLLAAYDFDEIRIAARAEAFQTRATSGHGLLNEDGHAFTAAASWTAKNWLRLTAELIAIDSRRGERILTGLTANQSDTQFQLSARFLI